MSTLYVNKTLESFRILRHEQSPSRFKKNEIISKNRYLHRNCQLMPAMEKIQIIWTFIVTIAIHLECRLHISSSCFSSSFFFSSSLLCLSAPTCRERNDSGPAVAPTPVLQHSSSPSPLLLLLTQWHSYRTRPIRPVRILFGSHFEIYHDY